MANLKPCDIQWQIYVFGTHKEKKICMLYVEVVQFEKKKCKQGKI